MLTRRNINSATGGPGVRGGLLRALVVLASLASLCVSDGIGPRLVPFPSRPSQARPEPHARADAAGASLPSVARRAEKQAASADEPKAVTPVWNNSSLDRAALSPPSARPAARPDLYASPGHSFRPSSSTRGRAPPQHS